MKKSDKEIKIILKWVEKAENDLVNAEHTLTLTNNCPYDTVCYHSQQCAEKYLKALLIYEGIKPPKIHDLSELIALHPQRDTLELELEGYEILMLYAVDVKYPGFSEEPTRDEAEMSVNVAKNIRDNIRKRLSSIL